MKLSENILRTKKLMGLINENDVTDGVKLLRISSNESQFGPSFGGKHGTTDFYKILFGNDNVGELEFDSEKNEILSIYVDNNRRGKNIAKLAINKLFDYYDTNEMYAWAAKTSLPFWRKVSNEELPNNYFVVKRGYLV